MSAQIDKWELDYLNALITGDESSIAAFEALEFLEPRLAQESGVLELVLYRLIARLETTTDAITLLHVLEDSTWEHYTPRVLARIADTDELLRQYPKTSALLQRIYEDRSGATNYTLGSWRLIGDPKRIHREKSPAWSRNIVSILDIVEKRWVTDLGAADIRDILNYFFNADIRLYSLTIITFYELPTPWADTLHRVLAVPYLNVVSAPAKLKNNAVLRAPSDVWAPKWQIRLSEDGWNVQEEQTGAVVDGLGPSAIYDVLGVLLTLGGLLRDGVMSSPTRTELVKPLSISQPIWGFRDTQYAAESTRYRSSDIRALALGLLEHLPATTRVVVFRSRLAMSLIPSSWNRRRSSSVVTLKGGFYDELVCAAQLFGNCEFKEVVEFAGSSQYANEPAMQNLVAESQAAIDMLDEAQQERSQVTKKPIEQSGKILCVMHASVPHQTGGYAIRAHGILSQLREYHFDVQAVTRPGFPHGPLTHESEETVDGVQYRRLSDTSFSRADAETQHMQSYIQKFEELFSRLKVGKVHVRSTYLIALPALIAARRLGLPVLYEVSGLWELVYRDREHASHLLKRSRFAELAETVVMRNADRLVVMNEAVKQIAIDRGVDSSKIAIAPNAVNVEHFTPVEPLKSGVFTLGYLGSFVDYEGLDVLLDALKILNQTKKTVKLLMVGDGAKFAAIRRRVRKEGLEEIVEFTGRLPHDAVKGMYERMDALVYPRLSTHATEAITPLKPFEALAMAKPIVVSDVRPLQEIVGDDERGLAFPAGNAEQLAQTVCRLMSDPVLGTELGEAGRQWVRKYRNWGTVVEVFREAYSLLD